MHGKTHTEFPAQRDVSYDSAQHEVFSVQADTINKPAHKKLRSFADI